MKPLHPFIVRAVIREVLQECRWRILAAKEEKRSWEEPDIIRPEQIPHSATLSGWMRNLREAIEYDRQLRRQ